jgi:hypothetical protein
MSRWSKEKRLAEIRRQWTPRTEIAKRLADGEFRIPISCPDKECGYVGRAVVWGRESSENLRCPRCMGQGMVEDMVHAEYRAKGQREWQPVYGPGGALEVPVI